MGDRVRVADASVIKSLLYLHVDCGTDIPVGLLEQLCARGSICLRHTGELVECGPLGRTERWRHRVRTRSLPDRLGLPTACKADGKIGTARSADERRKITLLGDEC